MASGTVRVKGLAELNRALKKMEGDLPREVRKTLIEVAEPVKRQAENLAASHIKYITDRWAQMRVGVTTRSVYIAPKARRRGGSPRPNFGAMLMNEAMIPALAQTQALVVHSMDQMLDSLGRRAGF